MSETTTAAGPTALVVSGSPARRAHTRALAEFAAIGLRERAFRVELVDLAERTLPTVDPVHYWSEQPHPDAGAAAWIALARSASAVVLATPVQHASYSGLLKSALDLLPADAFEYTPVCVAAHASGAKGSTSACEHLRGVVKALGGWTTPTQITTVNADFEEVEGRPTIVSPAVRYRREQAAEELTRFALALNPRLAAQVTG